MKRFKEYYVTIIVIATVLVINIAAFCLYISNINKDIEKQTEDHLAEMMEEASTCVELKVEETIHELEMTAYYIGMNENYTDEQVLNNISKMTAKAGFSEFDIVDSDGKGMEEKGLIDYSQAKFYTKSIKGDVYIADTKDSDGNVNNITFSLPVMDDDNHVKGVYLVTCTLDEFSDFLDLDSVSKKGKAFIIKSDGTVLSKKSDSSIQNVSDILNNDDNVKTLKNYMKSKKSGVVGFDNGKESKRYICFSKTNFNNWEIITVVSSSSVEANISDVTDNFVFLGIIIGAMLIVLSGYFVYTLITIKSKNAINLRRYFMVSKYTEDIIVDYSCVKNTLYCNENWFKIFGYELPKVNVKESLKQFIYKDDQDFFMEKIEQIKQSDELVPFKCRLLDSEGKEIVCICKLFGIKDNMKKLIKIVGVIEKSM
ncbi:MAG: cache domain-containing protein [Lachnospiraceae bacterium]|nr:cache domain-containing protein [Lachnospiraceae bacterium]